MMVVNSENKRRSALRSVLPIPDGRALNLADRRHALRHYRRGETGAVSGRLTLEGTDDARLTLLGTDDTRLTLEGTDDARLTLEGV